MIYYNFFTQEWVVHRSYVAFYNLPRGFTRCPFVFNKTLTERNGIL